MKTKLLSLLLAPAMALSFATVFAAEESDSLPPASEVPAEVQMYTGIAAPVPGWGSGGGLQFELGQYIPAGSYGSGILLP